MYLNQTAQNFGRRLAPGSDQILQDDGFRIGDRMTVIPLHGRKKEIKILRNKIVFQFDHQTLNFSMELATGLILKLPSLYLERKRFELTLCSYENSLKNEMRGRFLLKSCDNHPFTINGVRTFETFIERGDKIDIDHNTFIFHDEEQRVEKLEEILKHPILSNKKILRSKIPILMEGETGTGKSYLAQKIHESSGVPGKFIHVNLSSFSPNLIESEIFGHVKGAFTGATHEKRGAIRESSGGTLFLDEIDSIPFSIQTKLLLFFDSKKIRPVGGETEILCNTRIILASGKSLLNLIQEKKIRDDFYYRVTSGVKMTIDPLRKNKDKIVKICRCVALEEDISIGSSLIDFYSNCKWPGNLRQLLGHLKRKKYLSKNRKIVYDAIDDELINEEKIIDLEGKEVNHFIDLSTYKFFYVMKLYYFFNRNIEKCASILNISGNTVRNILKKNNIKI